MMQQDGNLIVNYLPTFYREAELHDLFVLYGNIIKVKVIYHKDSDESMTYGFVRFQNPNDAIAAMSELNGREICGKRIKVGFARPGIDTSNCKLYVKRVPPSYTLDDVQNLFAQFGEILETRLLTDEKGHSRQVAFVQYTNRQDAEDAIMHLSGIVPPGGSQALVVKYATHPRQQNAHSPKNQDRENYVDQQFTSQYMKYFPSQSPLSVSTTNTSFKIDHYLQSKPLSSDWTDPYPQTCSPPPVPTPQVSSYLTKVVVSGVPPSLDIMDFHFLSKYGKVFEGKMRTKEIQVIYPDGGPINYQTSSGIIEFSINISSLSNFNNLLSLSGSMIVVEGHSIMMHVSLAR